MPDLALQVLPETAPKAMPETASVPHSDAATGPKTSETRDYTLPLTLLALALRLVVALVVAKTSSAQWLFSQATELGCLANSLLYGHGLSSPFCGDTGPSAFLAPGYPFFVAVVFRMFGPYTMHSAVCIVWTQALFSTATIPVVMWAARLAFNRRSANLAGFLCAVNPWLIGLEAVLWETSLSILLLTSLVGLAVALQRAPTRRRWYAAALVLAVAASVNPSLVLTGVLLFLASFASGPKRLRRIAFVPAMLFLLLCSFWPVRNLRMMHAFIPMRSNMGYELWQGNRPGADGFFLASLHPNVNAAEYAHYKADGELVYMREKSQMAATWVRNHPQRFAYLTLKRIACFWFGVGRTPSFLLIVSTAALTLAGFASLISLLVTDGKLAIVFAIPMLVLPLPYYVSHPDFRFWCLLAPTLTILTSWWLTRAWTVWRHGSRSVAGIAPQVRP